MTHSHTNDGVCYRQGKKRDGGTDKGILGVGWQISDAKVQFW